MATCASRPYVGSVPSPHSYLLCGTPRTGSTLLCSLLSSTGVAGRPESYFRVPDQQMWAARFGLALAGEGDFDFDDFVDGAIRMGSTGNGVFAARIMWGTMHLLVQGLGRDRAREATSRSSRGPWDRFALCICSAWTPSLKRCHGRVQNRPGSGSRVTRCTHRPD